MKLAVLVTWLSQKDEWLDHFSLAYQFTPNYKKNQEHLLPEELLVIKHSVWIVLLHNMAMKNLTKLKGRAKLTSQYHFMTFIES